MKPEASLTIGIATGALVWSIYARATPSLADIRVGAPNDPDLASARKAAAWTSAGTVAFVSLIAKDPVIFIIGGAMVVAVDIWTRIGNAADPMSGATVLSGAGENTTLQDMGSEPVFMSGVAA